MLGGRFHDRLPRYGRRSGGGLPRRGRRRGGRLSRCGGRGRRRRGVPRQTKLLGSHVADRLAILVSRRAVGPGDTPLRAEPRRLLALLQARPVVALVARGARGTAGISLLLRAAPARARGFAGANVVAPGALRVGLAGLGAESAPLSIAIRRLAVERAFAGLAERLLRLGLDEIAAHDEREPDHGESGQVLPPLCPRRRRKTGKLVRAHDPNG
jgi:hypothetical protein